MDGTVYKGVGGFYEVKTSAGERVTCRPRGILRRRGEKPLAGDAVRVEREDGACVIDAVLPRKNCLVRPPVANVDMLFIVASTAEPAPSFLVIDKLAAVACDKDIAPVVVVTKGDLARADAIESAYAASGIQCILPGDNAAAEIEKRVRGRLCVFCGNSGVGKSTLLNSLFPMLHRRTGEVSQKLGRGRHTTREVELFEAAGGLVADTPGFSDFDAQSAGAILPENLGLCFPEIRALTGGCRFSGCAHLRETGCAVRAAVRDGKIAQSRYDSYVFLYGQAKERQSRY